jgi:uncharacterized membrane protein (UPF0127 family)
MRGKLGRAPITFVLLAALLVIAAACERGPRVAIVAPDGSTLTTVKIELADTPQKQEMGLMYRDALAGDAGMLFVFAEPSHQVFWMKNTRIPLDLLFADSQQRVIGIVANAEPYSEARIGVPGDSQYVLEVNGGFCQQRGVKAGDRLDFLGFSPSASN